MDIIWRSMKTPPTEISDIFADPESSWKFHSKRPWCAVGTCLENAAFVFEQLRTTMRQQKNSILKHIAC